jgi:hypothetical protein
MVATGDCLLYRAAYNQADQNQGGIMSFGAGHIFDMIARMKANKDLLRKRGLFREKEAFEPSVSARKLSYIPLTETEREKIREEVAIRNRQNRRSTLWAIILAITATLLLSYLLVFILKLITEQT